MSLRVCVMGEVRWFSEEAGDLHDLVDLDRKLRQPLRMRVALRRFFTPVLQIWKNLKEIADLGRRLVEVFTAPLRLFRYLSRQ